MNYKQTMLALLILAALLFSIFTLSVASSEPFRVSARSAVLYEPQSGSFIYEKNANERLAMASTTKIMTAIVALENGDLDEVVTVDDRAFGIEGSSAYLSVGDTYTLEDMLYALLLQSANDAAVAIACTVSGSVEKFVSLMNEKAKELKLENTHFSNPNGLDAEDHYTTAHDLALTAAHAITIERFTDICSTYKKKIHSVFDDKERLFVNHNKLLGMYEGAIGIKTGYTKKSGRCLVGAAEREGVTLISVTINAPDDWRDHKNMLDFGFDTLESRTLLKSGDLSYDIPILFSDTGSAEVTNAEDVNLVLSKGAAVEKEVFLPPYLNAPMKKGDKIGEVRFTVGDKVVAVTNLVLSEDILLQKEKGFLSRLFGK